MKGRRTEPDLEDVIEGAIDDLSARLNCQRVGIIETFYPVDQTADIKLVDKAVKFTTDGEVLLNFSLLAKCPVIVNKGINGGLTIPINAGDTCTVHFNDRDLDNWLIDGLVQRPNTLRTHDFSDAIATIGIRNQVNKIADFNNEATELNYLTNKISLDSTKINLINSSGGSIVLDDKLELKNTAENLKGLIDELITIVTNLKTVDPISGLLPIDGATASSLSALSTRVGALLK
jgi:hypothetical protein